VCVQSTQYSFGSDQYITGYAGGSYFGHQGAAASYLCLPSDPQWMSYLDGRDNTGGLVYGAEYEITTAQKSLLGDIHNHDVPCAVCQSTTRATSLMIPARTSCYGNWHLEYNGYLMSGHYGHGGATDYVCVDKNPETIPGSNADTNGKLFYFVEAACGSLPCGPYIEGREIACAVCTK
jgi:hypothetical protein